ncbi:MAG: zinc ribbon domain-containing protein [candidate division KSB1 bacterium]|nr:zinc ribbon domain-containing protein [candidate division KSB1 bacterium]MDQ7064626.1 zinc ribbon domain-containing protein [candidate division KSB1 bacterium]
MPTYEYVCRECGYQFEEFHGIAEDPISHCPKCDGKVERLINGGIGLIFKGNGFYLTDYKNKSSAGSSKNSDKKK